MNGRSQDPEGEVYRSPHPRGRAGKLAHVKVNMQRGKRRTNPANKTKGRLE